MAVSQTGVIRWDYDEAKDDKQIFEMELVFNGRTKKFVRTLNDQVSTLLKRIELAMINIKTSGVNKPPSKKQKQSPPTGGNDMVVDSENSLYPYILFWKKF